MRISGHHLRPGHRHRRQRHLGAERHHPRHYRDGYLEPDLERLDASFASGSNTVHPTTYDAATGLWTYSFPSGNLVNGDSYIVTVEATNAVGGSSSVAASSFVYNTTPPTVTMSYPVNNTTYGTDWSGDLAGTAAGVNGASISPVALVIEDTNSTTYWNGSAFQSNPTTVSAASSSGNWSYSSNTLNNALISGHDYSVTAQTTDSAGNAGATTNAFVYNTTPPTVTMSYPVNNTTYGTDWSGDLAGTASTSI